MINLELKNENGKEATYKVPTSYEEMTVGQFNRLQKLAEKEYTNNIIMSMDMLHALTDCPLNIIESMDAEQFVPLIEHLAFTKDFDLSEEVKDSFTYKGVEITTKKKLNEQISVKEMILIENAMKSGGNLTEILKWLLIVPEGIEIDYDELLLKDIYGLLLGFTNGRTGS